MRKIKRTSKLERVYRTWKQGIMRKHDGMLIVWPAYFEKNFSRMQGRRIPNNLAASNVTLKILEMAAESSGFEFESEPDKQYPRGFSDKNGYLLVANPENHKKKRVLLMLAKGVRRAVAQRESARLATEKKKGKKKRRK
ncbi:MAG: signal recognition particle subunit SRP19/SEC65 family protein [Candidatus Thorarchaeota archaeon]|jgi:signal recognition particle subunit SRP19